MNYNLIINAWDPEAGEQCRRLTRFLQDTGLASEKGNMIILSEEESEESWGTLTELVPAGSVSVLYGEFYRPEPVLDLLSKMTDADDICIFPGNHAGEELAVRLAARKGGSSLTDVTGMKIGDDFVIGEKKIYSGNLSGKFRMEAKPFCITVDKCCEESQDSWPAGKAAAMISWAGGSGRDRSICAVEKETGLAEAPFVVVCGRGLGNKAAAEAAAELTASLGGRFGATRPVVMNAWAPMDDLIGVSGTMIRPDLCIVAGASGSPAFYAGIEKSKIIVAVNSDEDAPVMKKADVCIAGDWKEILSELVRIKTEDEK